LNIFLLILGSVFRTFGKHSLGEKVKYDCIYPSNHDAILSILRKNKLNINLVSKHKPSININVLAIQEKADEEEKQKPAEPSYKSRRSSVHFVFQKITNMSRLPPIKADDRF